MVHADGENVRMEGRYCDLLVDLANIVAAYVKDPDMKEDDVLESIKAGVRVGLEEQNV